MEVVNKLIDTEEALVNQFDHDDKKAIKNQILITCSPATAPEKGAC
jgi:hypothetical protein